MDIIRAATDGADLALDAAHGDRCDALGATAVFSAASLYQWSLNGGANNTDDPDNAKHLVSAGFALLSAAVLQGADLTRYLAELLLQTEEDNGAEYLDEDERRGAYLFRTIEAKGAILAQLAEAFTRRAA